MSQSQVLIQNNIIHVRLERNVTVVNEGETYPGCTQVEQFILDKKSGCLLKYLERVRAPNGYRLKSYYIQVQYASEETRILRYESFQYPDEEVRNYKQVRLNIRRKLRIFDGKYRKVTRFEDSRGNYWKPEWGVVNPFRRSVDSLFRGVDSMRQKAMNVVNKHGFRDKGIPTGKMMYMAGADIPRFKRL